MNPFDGYVLRPARVAPSNATTTAEPTTGVNPLVTFVGTTPPGGSRTAIEPFRDAYRVATETQKGSTEEYLVWAANASNLAIVEDPSWAITDGTPTVPDGTLSSGGFDDATSRFFVADNGGRDIAGFVAFTYIRGDDSTETEVRVTNVDAGSLRGELLILDPAHYLSNERGDQIVRVEYFLQAARFWWTRNDTYMTRFAWNGAVQRWEPLKGGTTKNVGLVEPDSTYKLSPKPQFPIGITLPGDSAGDAFAMLRIGENPGTTSIPLAPGVTVEAITYSGILVVSDDLVDSSYTFTTEAGIIGTTSGEVVLNPTLVNSIAGLPLWYSQRIFEEDSTGFVGNLLDAQSQDLYIAPVPGPTERPIITIGSRQPLDVQVAFNDADLDSATINQGQVGVSLSTGRLRFNPADVTKSDPGTRVSPNPDFELSFFGAGVFYKGVTGNQIPQPLRDPVMLEDATGTPVSDVSSGDPLFIPNADTDTSGVILLADGTGAPPNESLPPSIRPNGSGLTRAVQSVGDTFIFSQGGAVETLEVVDLEADLPKFDFKISAGTAFASREANPSTGTSQVKLARNDLRTKFSEGPIYFLQADLYPSWWSEAPLLVSRVRDSVTLEGTERLFLRVNATSYVWDASTLGAGTYDMDAIAASLNALTSDVNAWEFQGYLVIGLTSGSGSIEILYGEDTPSGLTLDFSGCEVLGLLPGWSSSGSSWNVDNGSAIGLFRSSVNLDRTKEDADFKDTARYDDDTLVDSVQPTPFVFVNQVPLRDYPGYDDDVFFRLTEGFFRNNLTPFEEVDYRFDEGKFAWIEGDQTTQGVLSASTTLKLGQTQVVEETLSHVVNGFLKVSPSGGPFEFLEPGDDFLIDETTGTIQLIRRINTQSARGARGSVDPLDASAFTAQDGNFTTQATVGDRLKITSGSAQGSYIITAILSDTQVTIEPPLLIDQVESPLSWELFDTPPESDIDLGRIADVSYRQLNHLPEEPFKVRVLQRVGAAGSGDLPVNATRAIASSRTLFVRLGLNVGAPETTVEVLRRASLGTLANETLFVPSYVNLATGLFSIQVGEDRFTPIGVAVFSPNPAGVQYLTTTGELKFNTAILSDYEGSQVGWVEEFTDVDDLPTGVSQLDPDKSLIRINSADSLANAGAPVYFGEVMVTEDRTDVAISPLAGTVNFNVPLLSGDVVETAYFQADTSGQKTGDEIVEFLPVIIRGEFATRVNATTYAFNPTARTVFQTLTPTVFVDGVQRNFGVIEDASINFATNEINLGEAVEESAEVTINYAVLEAFGGETAYSVSTLPVFREPFFLDAEVSEFTLETDRTSDFSQGQVMRLGTSLMYIDTATYDASTGLTTVSFFPPTVTELGSRSPGNDLGLFVTNEQVVTGFPTPTGFDGFLVPIDSLFPDLAPIRYEPVSKGATDVVIVGDVTRFLVAGHMIDLGGYPFTVLNSQLSDDGLTTRLNLGSSTTREFNAATDALSVSVRPIYPPDSQTFIGRDSVIISQPFELVLFGETNDSGAQLPGRTLIEGVDYFLNTEATPGSPLIEFVAPIQSPLRSNQYLTFSFTAADFLAPRVHDNLIIVPRYSARFAHVVTPNEDNGYEGLTLQGKYTYHSPDSWYYRVVPVEQFLGEVVSDIEQEQKATNPNFGSLLTAASDNQDFGNLGVRGEAKDLTNRDLVAQRLLSFYNAFISAFEQVQETASGNIIGDRDGKFRFFVGRGSRFTPPGFEDFATGTINPRNLWYEIFKGETGGAIQMIDGDPVVDPDGAFIDGDGNLDGRYIDADIFRGFLLLQNTLIRNDVDDIVIVGRRRPRKKRWGLGFVKLFARGIYKIMGEPHDLSRVFPETTEAFSTLQPGINGDADAGRPGFYSFGRILGRRRSTRNQVIGELSNPVLGIITQLQDVRSQPRSARARIWAYSPTGFPELDDIPGYGTNFRSSPRPAIICTPVTFDELPIDNTTGFPDPALFISGGGDIKDLTTGDFDLSTPGWEAGDQVGFGRPSGELFEAGYLIKSFTVSITGFEEQERISSVYVAEVFGGCVLTFQDDTGSAITNASTFVEVTGNTSGDPIELLRGDTALVVPRTGLETAPSDPPTLEELAELAEASPFYRTGFDVRFRKRTGEIVDATLPSFRDPTFLGLKEILGQKPPRPLSTIEATVEFNNTLESPLEIPALTGGTTNDDGDYSLPYLLARASEISQLRDAQNLIPQIIRADSPIPSAVYPEEINITDGEVTLAAVGSIPPATLLTSTDITPVTTNGFTPNAGIGDLRANDVLMVETNQAGLPGGSQGILHVGAVTGGAGGSRIEPPRFVVPTSLGDAIGYNLENAMAWIDHPVHASGMVATESPSGPNIETVLDLATTTLVFDDGAGSGSVAPFTSGLNDFFTEADPGVVVRFDFVKRAVDPGVGAPGDVITSLTVVKTADGGGDISLDTFEVNGGLGLVPVIAGTLRFESTRLVFETAASVFDFANTAAGIPHDFRVSVLTAFGQSYTEFIETDRLTFNTTYDLSGALPRGTVHPANGVTVMAASLDVIGSTIATTSGSPINAASETNGGVAFDFLTRTDTATTVGEFSGGRGIVRVMGFEGHGNTPISFTQGILAAVPSSDGDSSSVTIATGTGTTDIKGAYTLPSNRVIDIPPATDLTRIEPGDLLVISGPSTKAGTHLIRYAVPTNDASNVRKIDLDPGQAGAGFLSPFVFPTITGTAIGSSVTLTDATGFPATGRLYLVLDESLLSSTDPTEYGNAVFSAAYSTLTGSTFSGFSDYRNAAGDVITSGAFFAAASIGVTCSGMTEIPVKVSHPTYPNVPGNFTEITIRNVNVPGPVTIGAVTQTNATPVASTTFLPLDTIVYDEVPEFIDLTAFEGAYPSLWDAIHNPNGINAPAIPTDSEGRVQCPLPGDFYTTRDTSDEPSYEAQAGIFVEPSFPRPARDLNALSPYVVDASNTMSPDDVGMRPLDAFDFTSVPGTPEVSSWEVRRIRRFHGLLDNLRDALSPLRFLYEMRRGTITGYVQSGSFGQVTAALGTNLGGFTNENVNVNVGDFFRVLDASGNLLEERLILQVTSDTELLLDTPGLDLGASAVGLSFEIYLQQAPVPHEQSNQQLFDLVTDEVIFSREVDYTTQQGGVVGTRNILEDTDGALNFTALGVQPGDFIIVDPAGPLEGPTGPAVPAEVGQPPLGDIGYAPVTPSDQGAPSALDDNRGYYEVVEVLPSSIEVSAIDNEFGGNIGDDKSFGSVASEYVVYPTVNGSALTVDGIEGQVDLRPTAFADGANSFGTSPESVGPFGYRIVRPSPFVERDTVELVYFIRERMLSWIQVLTSVQADKSGTYFVFQRDEHIRDIEDPADSSTGLGVPSNAFLQGIEGVIDRSPFVNSRSCLSVLDRRYWILDENLDVETPSLGPPPYADFGNGEGRPVLPDRIDLVLNQTEELRRLRYAWLDFRVNRTTGTVEAIRRFKATLESRLEKQRLAKALTDD